MRGVTTAEITTTAPARRSIEVERSHTDDQRGPVIERIAGVRVLMTTRNLTHRDITGDRDKLKEKAAILLIMKWKKIKEI